MYSCGHLKIEDCTYRSMLSFSWKKNALSNTGPESLVAWDGVAGKWWLPYLDKDSLQRLQFLPRLLSTPAPLRILKLPFLTSKLITFFFWLWFIRMLTVVSNLPPQLNASTLCSIHFLFLNLRKHYLHIKMLSWPLGCLSYLLFFTKYFLALPGTAILFLDSSSMWAYCYAYTSF